MSTFYDKFKHYRRQRRSLLCVGLDPVIQKLPPGYDSRDIIENTVSFLSDIIAATKDVAIAYKPNLAFFEVLGPDGMRVFQRTIQTIRSEAPEALIIADAKRGDVGHTARMYADTFFQTYDCDAVTINPYMGFDTIEPFIEDPERAAIVLCHTSNPDADRFQNLGDPALYLEVARSMQSRNENQNLWLVVGATRNMESVERIRMAAPDLPFLVPGIGAQGGDLERVLRAAGNNVLINVGRAIMYTADHRSSVPDRARMAADRWVTEIRHHAGSAAF
ncbi:MAG: orotidine-5'-phosphate decarboxylase [Leptospiraceae bacterium]|nr:orotidine-5'-phosphate decarboxylase [Leptospiraceae bacterium]